MEWKIAETHLFDDYLEQWDELNRLGPNSPLLDTRFIRPLYETFKVGKNFVLATAYHDGYIIAITMLVRGRTGSWNTFQPSQSPLGIWIHDRAYPIKALLMTLAKKLPGLTWNIGVTQQDPDLFARPENDEHIAVLDYIQTARITLNGSFQDYWAKRGRNLRQNMNKQMNRLKKDNIETLLLEITSPEKIAEAVKIYGEIESRGWKSAKGTAIHINNEQGRFYTKTLSEFAASGNARIFQYLYNGEVVATDLCIDDDRTFIILKTTYDEIHKSTSPALLMRKEYFEQFYNDNRFNKIEFYGKVMPWHTKWTDEIRSMYHVNYYPWSIMKKLKYRLSK